MVEISLRPSVPFEQIYRNRIEKDVDGVRLILPSMDDLISLKTGTGRERDASDVEALGAARRAAGGKK